MATVVTISFELRIHGCRSLKEKRTVVRSIVDRLRNGLNVSVAETAFQDIHDRAELTVALVASDARLADSLADRVDRMVVERSHALVVATRREVV